MASTIFPNVNNAQITGGQFSIFDQRVTVHRKGTAKGLDLLYAHCALGALLDSNERFDPPRCAADTREALIEEILAWIYGGSGDSASMAWLFGGAGAGKSSLAQTIAEICQKEGRLAASFFFSRTSKAERSDGSRLIPTLVFQLMQAFPGLRLHVEDCIDIHAGLFSRASRTHMDLLFIKPLKTLRQQHTPPTPVPVPSMTATPLMSEPTPPLSVFQTTPKPKARRRGFVAKVLKKFTTSAETGTGPPVTPLPPQPDIPIATTTAPSTTVTADHGANPEDLSQPRFIVIDGLDECSGQEVQIELLRILATAIPLIPFPLRFLITSRPEGYITRTVDYDESFEGIDVRKIDLGNDENADGDIRRFLIRGFEEIRRSHPLRSLLGPSWPSEDAIETLVLKSSSHFIYASTAMKYIRYPRSRPDTRLDIILGLSDPPTADRPFAQIDALYTHIFMSMDDTDRAAVKHVFGILAVGRLLSFYHKSLIKLEEYMSMQAGEINILLEPLLSLVVLPENRERDVKILHASLFDFLLDESRSGGLHLDLDMARDTYSKYFLKEILTYTLDDNLFESTEITLNASMITLCWPLLYHCHEGHILDDLKEYLATFPFLHDCILHPTLILKYLKQDGVEAFSWISIVIQTYFTLLLEKDFPDGQSLHTKSSMQIEQRLQLIHKELGGDPLLAYEVVQEPLFNDKSFQDKHRVYKALANLVITIHGVEAISEALTSETNKGGPGNTANALRSHLLILFLPYLTHKDVEICTAYSKVIGYTIHEGGELYRVLQRRLEEYLQRVDGVADPSQLLKCKEAWGLVSIATPS